jgi:Terminase large subunit, T4likevirus-type, N-terminal
LPSYELLRGTRSLARELLPIEASASQPIDYAALCFGEQTAAIRCHAPLVALCCSGRAGKTESAALKWLEVAERKPAQLSAFISLTLKQSRRIIWRTLKRINKKHGLGLTFLKGEDLIVTHPNGSELHLFGANRDDLIDVLRGSPFAFVYFDEVAFFREGLVENAIDDALLIRMLDLDGELWIGSTPGYVEAGYHYDVIAGHKPGWKVFAWTYFDNPHLPEYPVEPDLEKRHALRLKAAVKAREKMGWTETTPSYVREWLGKYTTDLSALVYAFDRKRDFVDAMPQSWTAQRHRWTIVLGEDFGSTNATAWVVWAFEEGSADCYCVRAFKHYGMAPSLCADETKTLEEEFHPVLVVGDSAAKGYIDEHRVRHQIAIVGADKLNKRAHQITMNDAWKAGRIKLLRGETEAYASELERLGKNLKYARNHPKHGEEDPRGEKDVCDAGLYGWWRCWAWIEEIAAKQDEERKRLEEARRQPDYEEDEDDMEEERSYLEVVDL